MTTVKKRLNITLPDDIGEMLQKLSRRDRTPRATIATELIRFAIELEEDMVWNAVAEKRDKKGARFIPHEKAWK